LFYLALPNIYFTKHALKHGLHLNLTALSVGMIYHNDPHIFYFRYIDYIRFLYDIADTIIFFIISNKNMQKQQSNKNVCVVVIGMSGTGKTTFVQVHSNPRVENGNRVSKCVLYEFGSGSQGDPLLTLP
jgi:hypothetical protein